MEADGIQKSKVVLSFVKSHFDVTKKNRQKFDAEKIRRPTGCDLMHPCVVHLRFVAEMHRVFRNATSRFPRFSPFFHVFFSFSRFLRFSHFHRFFSSSSRLLSSSSPRSLRRMTSAGGEKSSFFRLAASSYFLLSVFVPRYDLSECLKVGAPRKNLIHDL